MNRHDTQWTPVRLIRIKAIATYVSEIKMPDPEQTPITTEIIGIAKQLAVIAGIVGSIYGTFKGLQPAQVDPLVNQISSAIVLLGSVAASLYLIGRNFSHKEAKADDAHATAVLEAQKANPEIQAPRS